MKQLLTFCFLICHTQANPCGAKVLSRLGAFAAKFSAQNSSTMTNAVKNARLDRYICKGKGNQHQKGHAHDV